MDGAGDRNRLDILAVLACTSRHTFQVKHNERVETVKKPIINDSEAPHCGADIYVESGDLPVKILYCLKEPQLHLERCDVFLVHVIVSALLVVR